MGPLDEDEPPEGVRFEDIHVTDVLTKWSADGAAFFSAVGLSGRVVVVQDQTGALHGLFAHDFQSRCSLQESGRFRIQWRVSPIQAAAEFKKSGAQRAP